MRSNLLNAKIYEIFGPNMQNVIDSINKSVTNTKEGREPGLAFKTDESTGKCYPILRVGNSTELLDNPPYEHDSPSINFSSM